MIFKSFKNKKDFQVVFKEGKRFSTKNLSFYFLKKGQTELRVSIVVSKKIAKKAVLRNKIKRRLKGIINESQEFLSNTNGQILIVPYQNVLEADYADLKKQFLLFSEKFKS